ncbi:hypothetical protein BGX34_003582 [Mortierella sp. NVP85]|nr:hypothetical protein BGX34_003582 [Mortierella sp. NVP85]
MSRRVQASSDILTDLHELEDGQRFAKVIGTRGNNVHEVQFEDGDQMLVNLPPKFRSLVWVKRGGYVVIQPAEEEDKTKVGGDIVAVLFPDHIKRYKQEGTWPFKDQLDDRSTGASGSGRNSDSDSDSDKDDDLFVNNNRIVIEETESESESESEDEESENDDNDK